MTAADALKVIATAANQAEGELIVGRLSDARINAIEQRASGNPEFGASGARYIYVQDADVERARAVLAVDEPPFTDDELAKLSEEAAEQARKSR
ncbi:MAG TPA: hypothetical protein VGI52_02405 [Solirubrobacteraceae bacterium]|jgi:hypothetical protein